MTIMMQRHQTMPANHPIHRPTDTLKEKVYPSIYERKYTHSFCHTLPYTRIFLILYQVLPPFHFSMCMCNWRWRMVTQRKQLTLFRSFSVLLIGVSFAHSRALTLFLSPFSKWVNAWANGRECKSVFYTLDGSTGYFGSGHNSRSNVSTQ